MDAQDEERPLIHHLPPQDETSEFTSDGTVDISNLPARKQRTGNWTACFFILGAEFTECVAFFAISKNLVTYLTGVLHESNVSAATTVSTWIGTAFFTPLIGAFLADTFWGRYWTIVIFISVYVVGMMSLTGSALLPLLMGLSYNRGIHRLTAYLGLYLVALGNGGIKPCVCALGADQFDAADSVERVTKGSFFNWYYFSVNIGSLLSATVVVWVQDNIGWGVGFAIPTALMLSGLAVFVGGRKVYRYQRVEGSPLTRVSQVVVAAVRNYHLVLPEDSSALHQLPSPAEGNHCKIQHTSQFRFLDKAAIVAPSSGDGEKGPISPWRLCTVSQVEELKTVLRMFPVWVSMVLFFAATAQMSSTFIEQGHTMDNHVGPFTVPPASLAIFDIISVMFCVPIYDRVLVPLARRATGKERGLSQLQRLGVGLALSVASMVYAALVEARRLSLAHAAPDRQPSMSIMWQAPAFAVLGAGEVFAAIGILEFFYDQSPDGMKSLGTALAQLAIAAGNYFNSAVLAAVAAVTTRNGKPGWIPDDLNKGHLDYFFWLMAVLGVVNLLHFLHCSIRYIQENYSKIRDVEKELESLTLEVKLTAGPKKAALEHLRKKIEISTEKIRLAKVKEEEAKKAWEVAAQVVKDEEDAKQKLCDDLNHLVQESAASQYARLEELKKRLESLNPSRDSINASGVYTAQHATLKSVPQQPTAQNPADVSGSQNIATEPASMQQQPIPAESEKKRRPSNLARGRGGVMILPKGRGSSGSGWTGAGFDVDSGT